MLKEISIEIIRKCPNNCQHCSSVSSRHCTEIIDFAKFKEVVDGVLELGAETICFSGGEPFLHPNIVEMIKYVCSKGLASYVYTSGIIFDAFENYISLTDKILTAISGCVTKLIFNIEAAKEETYDLIMGTQGCFPLMKLSALKATQYNISTEAHFVPMKLNVDQIEETINLCKNIGIGKISFLRLVSHGRAASNFNEITLSDDQTERLREILVHLKYESSVNIRIGVPLSEVEIETKCEAAKGKLNIKYDGGVYPCEVFKNNSIRFQTGIEVPNIFKQDIVSIYNKSRYLIAVRDYIKCFSCNANCENCVGQYLIETKEEVGANSGK
ncbi:MAG: radical SAM protein [Synergistaceae bacterium]